MPARPISMRKIREMLRLRSTGQFSRRQIAASVGIARSTLDDYVLRAENAGLCWPLPEELDDEALNHLLFPTPAPSSVTRPAPDFERVHHEMRRKGVTLVLLWQEYKLVHPDGYNYSRYAELYRRWRGTLDVVMRQRHKAGERLFVDYAGLTMQVVDPTTGEIRTAQIFVAGMGASSYVFAEATWSQKGADWIGSHVRCFAYLGGVPEIVVPDNLKSGVTTAHRYDPDLNRAYVEMAEHYGVAILPARPRKPRDKGKVESAVQVVEQWIIAPLRDRSFFSLTELNDAIARLLTELNNREFQKKPGSRRSNFLEIDRPMLRPLPASPYVFAEWKKARVNIDYHIDVDGHYYSVPYKHVGVQLDVRASATTIECFIGTRRIASHMRSRSRGQHTTITEHMPRSHQEYAAWTPQKITRWAASIGTATAEFAQRIIDSRAHPEQGYRACLGILRLAKQYGNERLEAAALRALRLGATRYKSIESILKHGLDQQPLPDDAPCDNAAPLEHDNIRGAHYYRQTGELTNA